MPLSAPACRPDSHRYFVAEVIGVPAEGMAHVLVVCTACGDFKQFRASVSQPGNDLRLLQAEKRAAAQPAAS